MQSDYCSGELSFDPVISLSESHDSRKLPYSHCQSCLRPLSEGDAVFANAKRNVDDLAKEDILVEGGDLQKRESTSFMLIILHE